MSQDTALVVGSAPLESPGGVEACSRAVVRLLREIGFETTYVAASDLLRKSRIARIPPQKIWRSVGELLVAAPEADRQANVVVTNGPIGWRVKGKVLSVHYYHGTYVGQADAVRSFITRRGYLKMRYLDGMVLERLAGVGKKCVACSDRVREEVRCFFGHDAKVVYCPIDILEFEPGLEDVGLLEQLGVVRDRRVVGLFVGVGSPTKGETMAYDVIRRTSSRVVWLAVGQHSRTPPPQDAIVAGRIPPRRMPALLRSVDVVLVSSIYDSFGFLIAEALAAGTPVVATSLAGSARLLMRDPPLDQWLVAYDRDPSALVAAVLGIAEDPRGARKVALEGRNRVARLLSYEVWKERFLEATGLG